MQSDDIDEKHSNISYKMPMKLLIAKVDMNRADMRHIYFCIVGIHDEWDIFILLSDDHIKLALYKTSGTIQK